MPISIDPIVPPRPATARAGWLTLLALGAALLAAGCERDTAGSDETAAAGTAGEAAGGEARLVGDDEGAYAQLAEKRQELVAEAVDAVHETYAALELLARNDDDGAVEALERATGKLEVAVTADPRLGFVPIDVQMAIHDVIATPTEVNALRSRAEEALDDGRLQEGRLLIRDLASEQVIAVTRLPLATYPDAIANAAALVHAGRRDEAIAALEDALSTLVVEETVFPLPLTRAEAFLGHARRLAERQRNADETEQLQALLAEAREQLDLARALGYATRRDLDALYDALEAVEDQAESDETGGGLYDRFKRLFSDANRSSNANASRAATATASGSAPSDTP